MKKIALFVLSFIACMESYAQKQLWGMTALGGQTNTGVIFSTDSVGGNYQVRYNFLKIDASSPVYTSMIQASNGMLYGMTSLGGKNNKGVIFQYNPSLSLYGKIVDFVAGSKATGSLMQASDGMLYGMTSEGGSFNFGTLFRFNPADSSLLSFNFDGTVNGKLPFGSLIQASDGMLYGMTSAGGANNYGVIFQFNPSNSIFSVKFNFDATSGRYPYGSLLQASDGMLYGMTTDGGQYIAGTLFQFDLATSTFTKKLDFGGTNPQGPYGSLIQASDGMLYGMTSEGSTALFQFNPVTSALTVKYYFSGTTGFIPYGSLMQANDGMLYGLTSDGGQASLGVLFQYNPATVTYTKMIDFNNSYGAKPYSSLMQASDGMLYGMTQFGGANNCGAFFKYDPISSVITNKFDFNSSVNGNTPTGSLMLASDGKLYGMTSRGGQMDKGVLFQYDPSALVFTKKVDFNSSLGANPSGTLMQASDGKLYAMAPFGGVNNKGVIFQYDLSTFVFTKKFDFDGTVSGSIPYGSLMQANDGMLYGMTYGGGTYNDGVIFQFNPSASSYTKKLDLSATGNERGRPHGSLMQASDGMLYGMAFEGGINYNGVLFKFNPSTAICTNMINFGGGLTGLDPKGSLMQASDGMLYGMAHVDLFRFNPTTSVYTQLFAGLNSPNGSLIQASNGMLYGMTEFGGSPYGDMIQLNPVNGAYTPIFNFLGPNGSNPTGDLLEVNLSVTSVTQNSRPAPIKIFPNPTSGVFNLQAAKLAGSKYSIYNIYGECIYQFFSKPGDEQIDLSSQPNGIYFIQHQTAGGLETTKIILNK